MPLSVAFLFALLSVFIAKAGAFRSIPATAVLDVGLPPSSPPTLRFSCRDKEEGRRLRNLACQLRGGTRGISVNKISSLITSHARKDRQDLPHSLSPQLGDETPTNASAEFDTTASSVESGREPGGESLVSEAPRTSESGDTFHPEPSLPDYDWEEGGHGVNRPHSLSKEMPNGGEGWFVRPKDSSGTKDTVVDDPESRIGRENISTCRQPPNDDPPYQEQTSDMGDSVNKNQQRRPKTHPVVYRYFGRSRVRTHRSDSIPFILLGPSVDHWKSTGKVLASRGFNVMACERVVEKQKEVDVVESTVTDNDDGEGEKLILDVLDALRWNRAILVGCDKESALAIEAAVRLAPERVAGLVLCGDLTAAEEFVARSKSSTTSVGHNNRHFIGGGKHHHDELLGIDSFLDENVKCPSTVVWNGDVSQKKSKSTNAHQCHLQDLLLEKRSVIVGGGSAPHRRLPEQFAWVLTRFVEEKVGQQPYQGKSTKSDGARQTKGSDKHNARPESSHTFQQERFHLPLPFDIGETLLSPGMLLVSGRIISTAIIYLCAARVAVYQYQNIRNGITEVRSWCATFSLHSQEFISRHFARDWERVSAVFCGVITYVFSLLQNTENGRVHSAEEEKSQSKEAVNLEDSETEPQIDDKTEDDPEKQPPPKNDENQAGPLPVLDHVIT